MLNFARRLLWHASKNFIQLGTIPKPSTSKLLHNAKLLNFRWLSTQAASSEENVVHSPFPDMPLRDVPMHQFVFDACDKYDRQMALIDLFSGASYSYGELGARCRSVAVGWHRAGLRKGDGLALLLPNCAQFVFAFTAAATRGALCSGLNPAVGQYGGTGAKFVVTCEDVLDKLGGTLKELGEAHNVQRIYIVDHSTGDSDDKCPKSGVPISPFDELYGDPAEFTSLPHVPFDTRLDSVYMPYSSGTTGLPKGVLVSHHMMAAQFAVLDLEHYVKPKLGEHSVMFLPMFHMYAFVIVFKQLCDGCTVVLQPRFEPDKFFSAVQKYEPPVLYLVPPILVLMAKSPLMDNFDLSSIKSIITGAAPVYENLIKDVKHKFPWIAHVLQGYGMTETGLPTHYQTPLISDPKFMAPGSVGPLAPNFSAKIVSTESGDSLGANEIGEMWIRGPALMLGYHERPTETWETIDHDGWLHTGDMAYYDTNGNFFIVERLKELIKVSGFQVAPAELEDLLLSHKSVSDAAVVPVEHVDKGQVPRAYIVLKQRNVCEDEKRQLGVDIAKFVEDRAAHYKRLDGGIQFVGEIPKLPSGKILRRILREQAQSEIAN